MICLLKTSGVKVMNVWNILWKAPKIRSINRGISSWITTRGSKYTSMLIVGAKKWGFEVLPVQCFQPFCPSKTSASGGRLDDPSEGPLICLWVSVRFRRSSVACEGRPSRLRERSSFQKRIVKMTVTCIRGAVYFSQRFNEKPSFTTETPTQVRLPHGKDVAVSWERCKLHSSPFKRQWALIPE